MNKISTISLDACRESGSHDDYLSKVILIGDSGVGKSSFLLQYINGTFTTETPKTIG